MINKEYFFANDEHETKSRFIIVGQIQIKIPT